MIVGQTQVTDPCKVGRAAWRAYPSYSPPPTTATEIFSQTCQRPTHSIRYSLSYDNCSSEVVQKMIDFETAVQSSKSMTTLATYRETFTCSVGHDVSFSSIHGKIKSNDSFTSPFLLSTVPGKHYKDNASSYRIIVSTGDHKDGDTEPKSIAKKETRDRNIKTKTMNKKISKEIKHSDLLMGKRLSFKNVWRKRWKCVLNKMFLHCKHMKLASKTFSLDKDQPTKEVLKEIGSEKGNDQCRLPKSTDPSKELPNIINGPVLLLQQDAAKIHTATSCTSIWSFEDHRDTTEDASTISNDKKISAYKSVVSVFTSFGNNTNITATAKIEQRNEKSISECLLVIEGTGSWMPLASPTKGLQSQISMMNLGFQNAKVLSFVTPASTAEPSFISDLKHEERSNPKMSPDELAKQVADQIISRLYETSHPKCLSGYDTAVTPVRKVSFLIADVNPRLKTAHSVTCSCCLLDSKKSSIVKIFNIVDKKKSPHGILLRAPHKDGFNHTPSLVYNTTEASHSCLIQPTIRDSLDCYRRKKRVTVAHGGRARDGNMSSRFTPVEMASKSISPSRIPLPPVRFVGVDTEFLKNSLGQCIETKALDSSSSSCQSLHSLNSLRQINELTHKMAENISKLQRLCDDHYNEKTHKNRLIDACKSTQAKMPKCVCKLPELACKGIQAIMSRFSGKSQVDTCKSTQEIMTKCECKVGAQKNAKTSKTKCDCQPSAMCPDTCKNKKKCFKCECKIAEDAYASKCAKAVKLKCECHPPEYVSKHTKAVMAKCELSGEPCKCHSTQTLPSGCKNRTIQQRMSAKSIGRRIIERMHRRVQTPCPSIQCQMSMPPRRTTTRSVQAVPEITSQGTQTLNYVDAGTDPHTPPASPVSSLPPAPKSIPPVLQTSCKPVAVAPPKPLSPPEPLRPPKPLTSPKSLAPLEPPALPASREPLAKAQKAQSAKSAHRVQPNQELPFIPLPPGLKPAPPRQNPVCSRKHSTSARTYQSPATSKLPPACQQESPSLISIPSGFKLAMSPRNDYAAPETLMSAKSHPATPGNPRLTPGNCYCISHVVSQFSATGHTGRSTPLHYHEEVTSADDFLTKNAFWAFAGRQSLSKYDSFSQTASFTRYLVQVESVNHACVNTSNTSPGDYTSAVNRTLPQRTAFKTVCRATFHAELTKSTLYPLKQKTIQDMVVHASSATNICGHDEELKTVYQMRSVLEGRVRRMKLKRS